MEFMFVYTVQYNSHLANLACEYLIYAFLTEQLNMKLKLLSLGNPVGLFSFYNQKSYFLCQRMWFHDSFIRIILHLGEIDKIQRRKQQGDLVKGKYTCQDYVETVHRRTVSDLRMLRYLPPLYSTTLSFLSVHTVGSKMSCSESFSTYNMFSSTTGLNSFHE